MLKWGLSCVSVSDPSAYITVGEISWLAQAELDIKQGSD